MFRNRKGRRDMKRDKLKWALHLAWRVLVIALVNLMVTLMLWGGRPV